MRGYIADAARFHLAFESLVSAEKKLLACLTACVEGSRDLRATEGTVGQSSAVFPGEGNSLRYALVDDLNADLGQPINVGFARAEIATLYRVVEKAVDAVAIVLVILGGVDSALRRDRVCPARRILEAETAHFVAEFAESSGCGSTGQSGADNDNGVTALIGRIDQLHVEASPVPSRLDRARRKTRVEFH